MVVILNKSTELAKNDGGYFDYLELAKIVVTTDQNAGVPGMGGFDLAEMKTRLELEEALEACEGNGEIHLENAQHKTLKNLIRAHRWPRPAKDLIEFADAILEAVPEKPTGRRLRPSKDETDAS